MFIGREAELAALEKSYSRDKFQMVVMYGRRRVGKTTLVSEFIKDKPAILFSAKEISEKMNLQSFSETLYRFFGLPASAGAFAGWDAAFDFIAEQAVTKKFILAIDEFPYAANASPSLTSTMQHIIDHKLRHTGLFLLLCGSQIGFMESEVLGYKSPLFGRRTAQIELGGLDYYDAAKMLPDTTAEDKIKYYATFGGTPHYLAMVDTRMSFEENVKELYFAPQGYLFTEPTMLLKQELREPTVYNSILTAIATGSSRLNEISTKIGENTSKTIKYIKTLMGLKLVHRVYPFGDNPERSRKCIYQLSDNCFRFWYRYVFPHTQAVETGTGPQLADTHVFPDMSAFVGKPAFEEICKQYLIRRNKLEELPFLALTYGTWWGQDTKTRTQADIDIVAANPQEKSALLCECKWTNTPPGEAELRTLYEKNRLLPGYENYYYTIFTKTATTKTIDGITNVTADELFE